MLYLRGALVLLLFIQKYVAIYLKQCPLLLSHGINTYQNLEHLDKSSHMESFQASRIQYCHWLHKRTVHVERT